ncbi:MAG TPA: hypothetical protein VGH43_11500 [Jatrophihabitans sp.]|jgi:hypothetical protein
MLTTAATDAEVRMMLPGDELVPDAITQMDRATTFPVPVDALWPWIVQLGKDRAGWYLPRSIERFVPPLRRAVRHIDPKWQDLKVGDDEPDWGPGSPVLRAHAIDAPNTLSWHSLRDRRDRHRWPAGDPAGPDVLAISWTLALRTVDDGTRLHHRLRIRAKHASLVKVGDMFDNLTIIGMFAGLRERVTA